MNRHLPHHRRFAASPGVVARSLVFNPLAPRCNVTLYAAHDEPHSTLALKRARVVALPAAARRGEAETKYMLC